MKNKLLSITIIMLLAITLVAVVAGIIILKLSKGDEPKEPKIEEVVASSVDIPEITTNLVGGKFIKISFKIQTDSEDAKAELEQRDFQVKDIIIKEISETDAQTLKGKDGIVNLENNIKEKINELMQEGTIIRVYTTSFILQ
ncbi:MAG: fliL [Bacillales bacterium]|nr:fliL [Bacillales bacterium]